jgi:TusA-related sulfurtransferase
MCSTPKASISLKKPGLIRIDTSDESNYRANLRSSVQNVERLQQQRQAEFEHNEPAFHHEAIIDQLRCPLHLLQFKQALKATAAQQTLKITTSSKAIINDLQSACQVMGLACQTRSFRKLNFLYATQI